MRLYHLYELVDPTVVYGQAEVWLGCFRCNYGRTSERWSSGPHKQSFIDVFANMFRDYFHQLQGYFPTLRSMFRRHVEGIKG